MKIVRVKTGQEVSKCTWEERKYREELWEILAIRVYLGKNEPKKGLEKETTEIRGKPGVDS